MRVNKTLFIDFHDSFSLNIVSEFYRLGVEVDTIVFADFLKSENLIQYLQYENYILGPGPGHPNDYLQFAKFQNFLSQILSDKEKFIIGICVGHQLIGKQIGLGVVESQNKKHGETVGYRVLVKDKFFPSSLEGKLIEVQRYNSLTLKQDDSKYDLNNLIGLDNQNEILCLRGDNFLTYQFHPESVGTIYREEIFLYLSKTLYN